MRGLVPEVEQVLPLRVIDDGLNPSSKERILGRNLAVLWAPPTEVPLTLTNRAGPPPVDSCNGCAAEIDDTDRTVRCEERARHLCRRVIGTQCTHHSHWIGRVRGAMQLATKRRSSQVKRGGAEEAHGGVRLLLAHGLYELRPNRREPFEGSDVRCGHADQRMAGPPRPRLSGRPALRELTT